MKAETGFGFSRTKMPKICPDCQRWMSEIRYDNKHWKHLYGSDSAVRHYRECSCGCLIVWAYPNVFIRQHILPLFNERLVLGKA